MSRKLSLLSMAAVAAVAVAGCAPKRPPELPPAPAERPLPPSEGPRQQMGVVPGSAADFLRTVTSDTIHFGFDAFDIDDQSRAILDSQAMWLLRYPGTHVKIEGHCDERGTREYNLALGDRRANSAKNYLAAKGISPDRITTISYGKERPIALGSDEASWAQNRRAVTVVIQ